MADNQYKNQLNNLLTNPGSFSGTPGYQYALDQGLQATARSNSSSRNSGNALAALQDRGAGMASQDYGNQIDRLGKLSGQQDQYNLGSEQNANTLSLGNAANANNAQRNSWENTNTMNRNANDFSLGQGRNANDAIQNSNNYSLGLGTLGNTAQNNWYNYDSNMTQNANSAARNQNDFNIANGRNNIDWFNAGTNRGSAQSRNWWDGQASNRGWDSLQNGGRNYGSNAIR